MTHIFVKIALDSDIACNVGILTAHTFLIHEQTIFIDILQFSM